MGSVNHLAAEIHKIHETKSVSWCDQISKPWNILQYFTANHVQSCIISPAHFYFSYKVWSHSMYIGQTKLYTLQDLIKAHTFFRLFYRCWRQCVHRWSQSCLFIFLHLKSGGLKNLFPDQKHTDRTRAVSQVKADSLLDKTWRNTW